ncbi:MAG: hypothetical protein M3Z32_04140 [Acidobacteriota bacterium]|nr:hypothetical protein [Acidobacteriota bacterium]
MRVIASRERARNAVRKSGSRGWFRHAGLTLDNLMKPLALPAAGGLCAAILLFMILVPTFSGAFYMGSAMDVPTGLFTGPTVKSLAPIGFQYGDAEVDLRIDEQGRIVNYAIVGGQGPNDALHRSIENNLLFTQFTPATAFGVPITGTLRLSFRSSRIDVKG